MLGIGHNIVHLLGTQNKQCMNCGCSHAHISAQSGHLYSSSWPVKYPKPFLPGEKKHWCAGHQHHPQNGSGNKVWESYPHQVEPLDGNHTPQQPHEMVPAVNPHKHHTVHIFTGVGFNLPNDAKSTCCGVTMAKIKAGGGQQHLYSTDISTAISSDDQGLCPLAGIPSEMLNGNSMLDGNEKANCLICGWPRSMKDVVPYHENGEPFGEGALIEGEIYDQAGKFLKVVCENHCWQCHQPEAACQCCKSCHHYPCACDAIEKKKIHAAKVGLKAAQHPAYEEGPPPVPHKSWVANTAWQCKVCNEHFKTCTCEAGPTDWYGKPVQKERLQMASQCMPVPWIHRGLKPVLKHVSIEKAWPNIHNDKVDPVEWAADFYLYQAICSGGLNSQHECDQERCTHRIRGMFELSDPPVLREARHLLSNLIDDADLTFREYIDMACGGEVRHHPSLPQTGALDGNRSRAWAQWRDIRDTVGLQALLDMAALFLDYQTGTGGVAGRRWADAALLLHRRLTGGISKVAFVDQTFSLVHNGGVFLNKLPWKGDRLYALQGVVLPAQARDDFDTMLDFASPLAGQIFVEAWRETNRARIMAGVQPAQMHRERGINICQNCGMPSTSGHRTWECRTATTYRERDKSHIEHLRKTRWVPAWSWDMKTMYLYSGKEYRVNLHPQGWIFAEKLMTDSITVPENKRQLVISDGDYNFFKCPVSKFKGQEWKLRDLIELHGVKVQLTDWNTMNEIEEVNA